VGNFSNFQKQRLGLWLITFAAIEYFFALFENSTLLTFFLIFFPAILVILLPKIKFIAEAKEIHIYESMFWLFITVPYFHYFFGVLNSFIVFFLTVGFSITSAPFGRGKIKLFGIGTSIVIGLSIYIFTSFTYLSCLFLSLGIIKFLSYDIVKPKNKSRNTATENEQLQVFRGIILEFITDDVESKYKKHKDYEEYLKWDISPLKTDALQTYHLRRIGYHLATKFNDEMTAENAFGYAFKIVDIQIDVGITNLQDAQEELTDILNDYMFCNEGEAKILADHYKIKL
jgi:hypothetical protein